jgi:heme/copper-type cytochrome/quinol oxidase subunit 4
MSEVYGGLSVILALVSYTPYLASTLQGSNKPHVFSWVLWSLLTWIAFAIQVVSGAGPGAWATGVTAFYCAVIASVSLKHGEKRITRSDWVAFLIGLLTIPLWIATNDPVASALLVTAVDLFGFYPTFRKSWSKPREEMVSTHILSAIKHGLSISALSLVSIPTAFYPAALLVANVLLSGMILARRLKA